MGPTTSGKPSSTTFMRNAGMVRFVCFEISLSRTGLGLYLIQCSTHFPSAVLKSHTLSNSMSAPNWNSKRTDFQLRLGRWTPAREISSLLCVKCRDVKCANASFLLGV
jgi:hypothetical protein